MSNSNNVDLGQESFNSTELVVFNDILSSNVSYNGTAVAPLSKSEMVTLILIGILGTIGVVMNTGVLAVVYLGCLVKKDYRMVYYIFITFGDLLFATHTVLNAFSILYRDLEFFKQLWVCWILQILLGIVAYQWSAMCIISLIVDLYWSIKCPFSEEKKRKVFSKCICIITFVTGIASAAVPYFYWNDAPEKLEFCSIANVYGSHWKEYQVEAVTVLSILFVIMLMSSLLLLFEIHRTHKTKKPSVRHSNLKNRLKDNVINNDVENVTNEAIVPSVTMAMDQKKEKDFGTGVDNGAYVYDGYDIDRCTTRSNTDGGTGADRRLTRPKILVTKDEDNQPATLRDNPDDIRYTLDEVRRAEFMRACRTVGLFMATFVGCCGPYYIWMAMGIGCSSECSRDTNQKRTIRALVATALYLLPIVDPILYTQRFELFKVAALRCVRGCFRCSCGPNEERF